MDSVSYQHGGDIYKGIYRLDFSANVNPFGMPAGVRQAAAAAAGETAYPDPRCRALRSALAAKLRIPEEWLIFGNGAAELLFALALARKPARGLIFAPAFQEYEQALRSVGCQVTAVIRREETGFALGSTELETLKRELAQGAETVFVCTPDNPSGALADKALLKEMLRLCESCGAILVADESFYEFAAESEEETLLTEAEGNGHLFLLRSFTKMYGMAGLRLGYGICSDRRLLDHMESCRQPWSVSAPAQAAGLAALKEKEWVRRSRTYIREEREWLSGKLQALGCRVFPSDANYLLFYTRRELFTALEERGILIRDCANFRGLTEGYYRIAVRRREENRQLLRELRQIMEEN